MQHHNSSMSVVRLVALGSAFALVILILVSGFLGWRDESGPQNVASVPQQTQGVPSPLPTNQPPLGSVTPAQTSLPSVAPFTPSVPANTPLPTIVTLQPPTLITPTLVVSMSLDSNLNFGLQVTRAVSSTEPISSLIWAPTGDKLLYVTNSGKLYWCNPDGTNKTLLHTYEPDMLFSLLNDQQPTTNTLLLSHVGPPQGSRRASGHLDVIRFTPGQPPTLEEVPEAGALYDLHWWSPSRASGIMPGVYAGGDKLVTVDANGHIVDQRNIPYIFFGAIRPGGEWLAYSTGPKSTSAPFYGSDPDTAYLLNLGSGQRLQISPSGKGAGPMIWSHDGNWLYMSSEVNGYGRAMLASPDGMARLVIPSIDSIPVWSPNGQRIVADSFGGGPGIQEEGTPSPAVSALDIVDVAGRRAGKIDRSILPPDSSGLMMKPAWSPDGSQLALLSWDPRCEGTCSGMAAAYYLLSVR